MKACARCGGVGPFPAQCLLDDDCPEVIEFWALQGKLSKKQVVSDAPVKIEPHDDFEDVRPLEAAHQPPADTSATRANAGIMVAEALRRLDELELFLNDAMSDGDRIEAQALIKRVSSVLTLPKDGVANLRQQKRER